MASVVGPSYDHVQGCDRNVCVLAGSINEEFIQDEGEPAHCAPINWRITGFWTHSPLDRSVGSFVTCVRVNVAPPVAVGPLAAKVTTNRLHYYDEADEGIDRCPFATHYLGQITASPDTGNVEVAEGDSVSHTITIFCETPDADFVSLGDWVVQR